MKTHEDVMQSLLGSCSPYINAMNYDVYNRVLAIEFLDGTLNQIPVKRLRFSGILEYHEENGEEFLDDGLLDSVIGIHWTTNEQLCIKTEKKEIILKLQHEPIVENI